MAARSPDMARFLARLRPELAASFSPEQLAAVELHFAMRGRVGHAIDWRKRIGWQIAWLCGGAGGVRAGWGLIGQPVADNECFGSGRIDQDERGDFPGWAG